MRWKYSVQGNSAPVPAMLSTCSSKVSRSYLAVTSFLGDDIDCESQEINRKLQPQSGTSHGVWRRRAEFSRSSRSEVGSCPILCATHLQQETNTPKTWCARAVSPPLAPWNCRYMVSRCSHNKSPRDKLRRRADENRLQTLGTFYTPRAD